MTYQETVDYLFSSTPVFEQVGATAYKEGLDTSRALDRHFLHPHHSYATIHIAGTNGKGSCSHTLASILQEAGYKVGLYTSPHLVDFRERIRVNGKMIDKERVVRFVEEEREFFEPLHPSFFELTTALAFLYFAKEKVDIAVIEVGLGGRLDCTNIITPLLSVITNISFDHTRFLGNTLPAIAKEKAGIIKNNVPVLIGERLYETKVIFDAAAKEKSCRIYYAEDIQEVLSDALSEQSIRQYATRHFGDIEGCLLGNYQRKNTNTILSAVRIVNELGLLPRAIHVDAVQKGFTNVVKNTGLRGRWESISHEPEVICDTGHNVAGWTELSVQIKEYSAGRKHIVFGMVDDKEVEKVMAMLPKEAIYYWTQPSSHRAFPVSEIEKIASKLSLVGNGYKDVATAYRHACANAEKKDLIFIGGSSYIVSDFLSLIG